MVFNLFAFMLSTFLLNGLRWLRYIFLFPDMFRIPLNSQWDFSLFKFEVIPNFADFGFLEAIGAKRTEDEGFLFGSLYF